MTHLRPTLTAAALCAVLTTPLAANPADVERVTEGLIAAGMAIELGDQCNNVDVRLLRGISFLQGLKRHLNDLGYSNDEIDAFIDNDDEKDRLEAIARQRLTDLGTVEGEAVTYCTVARRQIESDTQVGRLLR